MLGGTEISVLSSLETINYFKKENRFITKHINDIHVDSHKKQKILEKFKFNELLDIYFKLLFQKEQITIIIMIGVIRTNGQWLFEI